MTFPILFQVIALVCFGLAFIRWTPTWRTWGPDLIALGLFLWLLAETWAALPMSK